MLAALKAQQAGAVGGIGGGKGKSTKKLGLKALAHRQNVAKEIQVAKSASLQRVCSILRKPVGNAGDVTGTSTDNVRTEGDIKFVMKWLGKRKETLQFFATKSPLALKELAAYMGVEEHGADTTIFRKGDVGETLFVIVEGTAGVFLPASNEVAETRAAIMRQDSKRNEELQERVRETSERLATFKRSSVLLARGAETDKELPQGAAHRRALARQRWKKIGLSVMMGAKLKNLMVGARIVGAKAEAPLSEVMELGIGDRFGEMEIQAQRTMRRASTVKTKAPCLFFTLDKEHYLRMKSEQAEHGDIADYHRFLGGLDVFRALGEETIMRITYSVQEWTAPRGTVIVREGEVANAIHIIRRGECRVTAGMQSKTGASLPVGIVSTGAMFGEKSVLFDERLDFTIVAESRTTFFSIPEGEFKKYKASTQEKFMEMLIEKQTWHHTRLNQLLMQTGKRESKLKKPMGPLQPPHASRPIGLKPDVLHLFEGMSIPRLPLASQVLLEHKHDLNGPASEDDGAAGASAAAGLGSPTRLGGGTGRGSFGIGYGGTGEVPSPPPIVASGDSSFGTRDGGLGGNDSGGAGVGGALGSAKRPRSPTKKRDRARAEEARRKAATAGDGGGKKDKERKRSSSLWDESEADEERKTRTREIVRLDGVIDVTRHLLGSRPPSYDWENEVGPRSARPKGAGVSEDMLAAQVQRDKVTSMPLRRKALQHLRIGKKGINAT